MEQPTLYPHPLGKNPAGAPGQISNFRNGFYNFKCLDKTEIALSFKTFITKSLSIL